MVDLDYLVVNRGSEGYVAFIDASKAFDRINHNILFHKLGKHGAPKCFIVTLISWYSKLFSCVRCNGVLSKGFYVLCGVSSGRCSVICAFLNVYADKRIESLDVSGCGCHVRKQFFGCMMYAVVVFIHEWASSYAEYMSSVC